MSIGEGAVADLQADIEKDIPELEAAESRVVAVALIALEAFAGRLLDKYIPLLEAAGNRMVEGALDASTRYSIEIKVVKK